MWDIFQEIRINDLRARQGDAESSLRSASGDLSDLDRHVRKLALVSQALYEILKERTGITDEELRRKIDQIDMRDGALNGRVDQTPLKCPKCSVSVTPGALHCHGCGAKVAPKYPFEA
jgi:hypothetical protein